jgi:hypothetical protein
MTSNQNSGSMNSTTITSVQISFPEIRLATRDGHKLRGYFGTVFRDHSPLLHNHFEDGRTRYALPLVQYKVVRSTPILVGLQEGARLLTELFFQMKTLKIDDRTFTVHERDIVFRNQAIGVSDTLNDYRFATRWMALNERNYAEYMAMSPDERRGFLGRILVGNILSFYKGVGLFLPDGVRILATVRPEEPRPTNLKNTRMMAFGGQFTTNALLPDLVGLGKSVSRGFGTIECA